MPLSPTDFYAYSRATGAPVADTPEERARQAPDVYAFRQSQLQAPQQSDQGGFNVLDALGKTALAAGALASGHGLYSRLRGKGLGQAAEGAAESQAAARSAQAAKTTAQVRETVQKAATSRPIPSSPPPQRIVEQTITEAKPNLGVKLVDLGSISRVTTPESLPAVKIANAPVQDPWHGAATVPSAQSFLTSAVQPSEAILDRLVADSEHQTAANITRQHLGETMVDQHNAETVQNSYQSVSAVNSSEDQMTGRVKHLLQQNPHMDMSQVELMENMAEYSHLQGMEQPAPIETVAVQLTGHTAKTQDQSATEKAQQFLSQKRAELAAQGMTPGRIEHALMQGPEGTRIKQGAELYAATGTPSTLELLSNTPSLPLTVQPKTLVAAGTEALETDVPTGALYKVFEPRDPNIGGLIHADIYHTNGISNAADKLASTPTHIDNPAYTSLVEQTNMAQHAMKQGDSMAAVIFNRNRAAFRNGQAPPALIPNPEHIDLQNEIAYHTQAREEVRNRQAAKELDVQRFPNKMAVQQMQEGTRAFAELDPSTGEIKPGTLELRPGRQSVPVNTVAKTATGTAIRGRIGAVETQSELNPESLRYSRDVVGGTYVPADTFKGQTYNAIPTVWDPSIHSIKQRTPEGLVYSEESMVRPTATQGKSFSTRPASPPNVARQSVELSEQVRRAYAEGGKAKAQALLESVKQGLM